MRLLELLQLQLLHHLLAVLLLLDDEGVFLLLPLGPADHHQHQQDGERAVPK